MSNTIKIVLPSGSTTTVVQQPSTVVAVNDKVVTGGKDKNYIHEFSNLNWIGSPKSITISHNLNKLPSVQVFDSLNNQVYVDVQHIDVNTTRISSNALFSGRAIFN